MQADDHVISEEPRYLKPLGFPPSPLLRRTSNCKAIHGCLIACVETFQNLQYRKVTPTYLRTRRLSKDGSLACGENPSGWSSISVFELV